MDSDALSQDCNDRFWPILIRLASEQLVLTAIAKDAATIDMPDDVAQLLQQMEAANRQRNLWLRAILKDANAQLQAAGIEAVAVKGAAFLSEDAENAASWRFFGDVDILVRERDLSAAVSALTSIGYIQNQTVYHPHHHRHYPFLRHPDGQTGIDVHTRLAGLHQRGLLDPDHFFDDAVIVPIGTGEILIPSATDRLAHLIVNAQILDYRYERRLFRLRDALDFAHLSARAGADLAEIRQRFARHDNTDSLDAYLTMMGRVLGSAPSNESLADRAKLWAIQVERVICDPRKARYYILKHWIRMALAHLADTQMRQFLIARLSDPRQREEFIWKRASYWRIFQR